MKIMSAQQIIRKEKVIGHRILYVDLTTGYNEGESIKKIPLYIYYSIKHLKSH